MIEDYGVSRQNQTKKRGVGMITGKKMAESLANRAGELGMDVTVVKTSEAVSICVKGKVSDFLKATRLEMEEQKTN